MGKVHFQKSIPSVELPSLHPRDFRILSWHKPLEHNIRDQPIGFRHTSALFNPGRV